MDWSNNGIVWRLFMAVVLLAAVSCLYVWADLTVEALTIVLGAITGFFFGQYVKTPEV